jgi:hypothetical protein
MARHGTFTSGWCYSLAMFHKDELLKRARALCSQSGVAHKTKPASACNSYQEADAFGAPCSNVTKPSGGKAFDMKHNALVAFAVLSAICGAMREIQNATRRNRMGRLWTADTLPPDVTRTQKIATSHHDDHNITRPRTREDVIRDIFRDRPSGAPDRPKP